MLGGFLLSPALSVPPAFSGFFSDNLKYDLGVMEVGMTIRFHRVALVVICTVLSLALNGTAFAQFKPGMNLATDKPVDPSKEAKRKETDEKYRETLKAIPDQPRKKADPWGNVRSPTPK